MVKQADSVAQLLDIQSQKFKEKTFIEFEDQKYSFAETNRIASILAVFLTKKGIEKGTIACVMLPNCPEYLFYWFALNKLGAVINPLNPNVTFAEAAHVLGETKTEFCLVNDFTKKVLEQANFKGKLFLIEEIRKVMKIKEHTQLKHQRVSKNDLAAILYTSGTTGQPKGVMLANKTFIYGGEAHVDRLKISRVDRIMLYLPVFYIGGKVYSVVGCLVSGATLVLIKGFSARFFWDDIVRLRITIFNVLGSIPQILLKSHSKLKRKHNIRWAYGTEISAEVALEFKKKFEVNLLQSYSLSESILGTANRWDDNKPGSIGKVVKHPNIEVQVEAKIVNSQGKEVKDGKTGEIVLKSPVTTLGYYKNPFATKKALKNGWFFTGDLGKKDLEGYFYFLDRKKDVIRKKGISISSKEIELAITKMPGVLEAAIIPVPSPLGGDNIKAYVVPKGKKLSPRMVQTYCKLVLSAYKIPDLIEIVNSLPKTSTNRIEKNILKKKFKPGIPWRKLDLFFYDKEEAVDRKIIQLKTFRSLITGKTHRNGLLHLKSKNHDFILGPEAFGKEINREPIAQVIDYSYIFSQRILLAQSMNEILNKANLSLDYIDRFELMADNRIQLINAMESLGVKNTRAKICILKEGLVDGEILTRIAKIIDQIRSSKLEYIIIGISIKKTIVGSILLKITK